VRPSGAPCWYTDPRFEESTFFCQLALLAEDISSWGLRAVLELRLSGRKFAGEQSAIEVHTGKRKDK
jgi:hypothetical protein